MNNHNRCVTNCLCFQGSNAPYIRVDPKAHELLKEKVARMSASAAYNQSVAEIARKDKNPLSQPRDKKEAENARMQMKMNDPNYTSKGNNADQVQRVWNLCVKNETFIKRVAMDSEFGLPEIYVCNPVMARVAAVLSSSNLDDPVPIQADRTFDASVLFVTTFVIKVKFLQWKGNDENVDG